MLSRNGFRLALMGLALTASSGLGAPLAVAAAAPPTPDIDWVEIQPDSRTVKIRWVPLTGVDGYEYYWRANATDTWKKFDWAHQVDLGTSSVDTLSPASTWNPQAGQSYQLTMVSKRYSDQAISAYATPAQVTMLGAVAGVAASAATTITGASTITTTWQAYTGPFASYNFFIAPSEAQLTGCYVGYSATASATSRTSTTWCQGAALVPGTTYWSAVRAIQKQDSTGAVPNVWTALASAPVTVPKAELIRTALVGSTWQIVNAAGSAVQLRGVSVRRNHNGGADQVFA